MISVRMFDRLTLLRSELHHISGSRARRIADLRLYLGRIFNARVFCEMREAWGKSMTIPQDG